MPALLQRPIRLTIEQYRLAFAAAGLSTVQWNLATPGTAEGRPEESAVVRDRALVGLRQQRLADGTGIHSDLTDALGIIARSDTQVSARLARAGAPSIGLVGAACAGYAVLATLTADGLDLEPVQPDDLVARTAHRITAADRLPGRPVTVPAELLAPGTPLSPAELDHRLGTGGVPRQDTDLLHTMWDAPKRAAASIEVARDSGAGRRTPGVSLTHVETDRGGIAFHYHRRDRRLWCTVVPCAATDLARLTTALLNSCVLEPHRG